MTGLVVLIAVFVALTALALWLDHAASELWAYLYGTDLRALMDRAHERLDDDLCDPGDLDGGDL